MKIQTTALFILCLLTVSSAFAQSPEIISCQPLQNAVNASANTDIEAVFDTDLDPATVNDTTVLVYSRYYGYQSGTISYNSGSRTVVFDPDTDFDVNDLITVILTPVIESSTGVPLAKGMVWSFTVAPTRGMFNFVPDSVTTASQAYDIFCADLNGDHYLDMCSPYYTTERISTILNNGNDIPTFGDTASYPARGQVFEIEAFDMERDGDMDIAVPSDNEAYVRIYENDGTGHYSFLTDAPVYGAGRPSCVGDFDGDGYVDIASFQVSQVSILYSNGDGAFQPYYGFFDGLEGAPRSIAAADLDNDFDTDIILLADYANSITTGVIKVHLNNGDGTFSVGNGYAIGLRSYALVVGDFSGDGYVDIAATAPGKSSPVDSTIWIYTNNHNNTFTPDILAYGVASRPSDMVSADFDADGDLDLLVHAYDAGMFVIYENDGSGNFDIGKEFPSAGSYGIDCADLDKDGDVDFVRQHGATEYYLYMNQFPGEIEVGNLDATGEGSFEWGIQEANSDPGINTIIFSTSGTINLQSPIPAITDDSTVILGSLAPDGVNSVVLNGALLPKSANSGLVLASSDNIVEGLTFTGFDGNGIEITGGTSDHNTLSKNLIYGNGLLGIDLGDNGVTVNDPGDTDTGPNELLNFPEIDSVFMNSDSTFTVYGRAADSSTIELFAAHPAGDSTRPADPSGYGEAYQYIGADTCDDNGDFVYTVPNNIPQFSKITATATDTFGNTSEFGENFVLTSAPLIIVGYSPINLQIFDPAGDSIGRTSGGTLFQTIMPASYIETGADHDSVHIDFPLLGEYVINVIGEDGADPGAIYSIGIRIDGTQNCVIVMDALVPAAGEVTSYTYEVEEGYHYINGDVDRNENINILDIIYLINYKFKGGPEPYPLYVADVDCDLTVNVLDIIYLIAYKFQSGPAPCPLEE